MTADLLIVVPTKGRTRMIRRLYESIVAHSIEEADILLLVGWNEYDEYAVEVARIKQSIHFELSILPVGDVDATYPEKLNLGGRFAIEDGGYNYLALFNDEHEVMTYGWDTRFKEVLRGQPFGIAYGPDGIWANGEIPSAPMITVSMYRALGWVALPGLWHILVDNVWKDLATACGTCFFLPDVLIKHHHRQLTGATDATYAETNDIQWRQDADSATYYAWKDHQGEWDDVAKLKELWLP